MATTTGGERWMRIDTTAETTVGVQNAVPTWRGIRVKDGGFNITEGPVTFEQGEQANVTTQPASQVSHLAPAGSVACYPSPITKAEVDDGSQDFGGSPTKSAFCFLLDAAMTRTAGALDSFTIQEAQDDIITRQFHGCKCNGFTLGFGTGASTVDFSTEWLGLSTGRLGTAESSAGALHFPSSRDWLVRAASVELGDQAGQGSAFSSVNGDLQALTFTVNNNLTPGKATRWYPAAASQETRRYGIRDLLEGQLSLTGSFVIKSEDATWYDKLGSNGLGEIRLYMIHPDGSVAVPSATSDYTLSNGGDVDMTVTADPTSTFSVDDVVYVEDHQNADPDTWPRAVLAVASVDATSIEVDTDGTNPESVGRGQVIDAQGTGEIWSIGAQFWIPQIRVQDITFDGSANDTVTQTVTFSAEIKATHSAPLRYLVR